MEMKEGVYEDSWLHDGREMGYRLTDIRVGLTRDGRKN